MRNPEGFIQIIEAPRSRINEVEALIRGLRTRLDDGRSPVPRRGTLTAGRNGPHFRPGPIELPVTALPGPLIRDRAARRKTTWTVREPPMWTWGTANGRSLASRRVAIVSDDELDDRYRACPLVNAGRSACRGLLRRSQRICQPYTSAARMKIAAVPAVTILPKTAATMSQTPE